MKKKTKIIVSVIVVIGVVTGIGTLAGAANAAGPGDALYSLDLAMERMRLSIASEKGEEELRVEYARERVEEAQRIIDQEIEDIEKSREESIQGLTEAEVTIGQTKSFVHLEFNGVETSATVASVNITEIIAAIAQQLDITVADVQAVLQVESETDAAVEDKVVQFALRKEGEQRRVVSDEGEKALKMILEKLEETRKQLLDAGNQVAVSQIDALIEQLVRLSELNGVTFSEVKIEYTEGQFEGKLKYENTGGTENEIEVKVEGEGGPAFETLKFQKRGVQNIETEIEFEDEGHESETESIGEDTDESMHDDSSTDDESDSEDEHGVSTGLQEAKAKVEDDGTRIEAKCNGYEYRFAIATTDRGSAVSAISTKCGVGTAEVDAILDFEA